MAHEPKDQEGRPYHIRLGRSDVGRVALLPGDPGRVPLIAERLEDSKPLGFNREYNAYAGRAGGGEGGCGEHGDRGAVDGDSGGRAG